METIEVNSQRKAERIIYTDKGQHRMHWTKMYGTDRNGDLTVKYLIFYKPKGV